MASQEHSECEESTWVVEFLSFKLDLNVKAKVVSKYW